MPTIVLAATSTPVWVAILVAALTGLFGLLSGAAAATAITTSHETRERFRDRMIEAADAFIAHEITTRDQVEKFNRAVAHALLDRDTAIANRVATSYQAPQDSSSYYTATPTPREPIKQPPEGDEAERLIEELRTHIPRLWVVFRSRAPAESATRLVDALGEASRRLSGISIELYVSDEMLTVSNELIKAATARQELLRAFNREIRRRWRL